MDLVNGAIFNFSGSIRWDNVGLVSGCFSLGSEHTYCGNRSTPDLKSSGGVKETAWTARDASIMVLPLRKAFY